jgi:hypothetical protein
MAPTVYGNCRERRETVGEKITVHVDPALVSQMRAKAVADGLPNAQTIPDADLLATLIRAYLGETAPVEKPVVVTPTAQTVWVDAQFGLNLRAQPVTGQILRVLADDEKLSVLGQQGEWLQVRASDGLTGWVSTGFVTTKERPPLPPKGNVRGIHGSAGMVAPPKNLWDAWIAELKAMGIAWYKQLDAGDPSDLGEHTTFAWAKKLKQNGIQPIIRYFQGQMFPGRLHEGAFGKMKRYAAEGIVWCEIGNEPNLDHAEWHSAHHGKLNFNNPFYPRTIAENWINDAEKAVAMGARPGFYAFAPTDWNGGQHPSLSSVLFYQRVFEHIAANAGLKDRFRRLFEPGKAWLSVHVSTYEFAIDFDPFPPGKPPHDMCLRGYEAPLRMLRDLLGLEDVWVMSTEGGVFCKDSSSMGGHVRLGSHQEHAERTVAMFDWLQKHSPLRAMCPWLICNVFPAIGHSDGAWANDGWFDGASPPFGPKPVVQAMKNTKPV